MGERFGSYEIEEKLGEGGMAEVFSAIKRGEDGFVRRVCIKRMLREQENDPAMVELFGDEARIMAGLHHPAIVSVLELGRHQGRSFLAMELVDGVDLRKVLRRTGPLSPEVAVLVAHEIASALDHAHRATVAGVAMRVVHRDVTPSNVLVSRDGTIKLTDFGIAKASARVHVTQAGIVKGKVPYMSPEQALGGDVDHRADLYSLGVVLFEALGARRPYDAPNDLDTLKNAQRGEHPALRELAPDVPAALEAVVHRLLRPRPKDRFQTAAALLDALAEIAGSFSARRTLATRVGRAIEIGAPSRAQGTRRARVQAPVERFGAPRTDAGALRASRALTAVGSAPITPNATRTELMPPGELMLIEAEAFRSRPVSRPSLDAAFAAAVSAVERGTSDDDTTERSPRAPLFDDPARTLAIPPTRGKTRRDGRVVHVGLGAFVAFVAVWLVVSAAVGAILARATDARPPATATALTGVVAGGDEGAEPP